jgi:hypothetical protein
MTEKKPTDPWGSMAHEMKAMGEKMAKRLGRLLRWLVSEQSWPWTFYVLFLVAGTVLAVSLLTFTNIGVTTTEVRELPEGGGELLLVERRSETSIPVVAVVTAITAAGWLVIPLRFLWDERAKRNDHRRQVNLAMCERIHRYVDQYYAPDVYRIGGIWACSTHLKNLLESPDEKIENATFYRLFYWFGRYWANKSRFDATGAPFFFRSVKGEEEVRDADSALRDYLKFCCGDMAEGDCVLARGVLAGGEESRNVSVALGDRTTPLIEVDFLEFQGRINSKDAWKALGDLCERLANLFRRSDQLELLISKAYAAEQTYLEYINEVYEDWYGA